MIDVMIITHNEALNLPHCLSSVDGWVNRVFVIDSGSTDGTQQIAEDAGATVIHHAWEGYARQKNWGLDNLAFESEWVLILDADEVITTPLKDRLLEIAAKPASEVTEDGFFLNRVLIFLDREIRHCGYFPNWNMRFFKRGTARYEDRRVHEHMIIDGALGYINAPMRHEDRRGLEHYVAKHNRYSTLESREIFDDMKQKRRDTRDDYLSDDTRWRRWLKRNVTPYVPAPGFWRFLYMYFFRMGFLDGRVGLDFCRFIAFYDNMVSLKLKELRRLDQVGRLEDLPAPGEGAGLAVDEGALVPEDLPQERADLAATAHDVPLPTARASGAATETQPVPAATSDSAIATAPAVETEPDESHQMIPESSPWSFTEKVFRVLWMLFGRLLFRLSFHNWYGFRTLLLRLFGASIGQNVRIRPSVHIEIPWNLDINDGVTVGDQAILYSLGKITIGERTIISQYAHICAGTHDHSDRTFPLIRDPVTIGADAWIGADAFVGPNVNVGRLSVLGARSSAYKSLDPETVYVGNPARALKKRALR